VSVASVRERIASACARVGRAPADVTLIAVTKYVPVEAAAAALAAGVIDLGENQAQQLRDRAQDSRLSGARWHFIGTLQRNKVRYVARWATEFHALDRVEVAEELSRRREDDPITCFIEVNLPGEATKAGVGPRDVAPLLGRCEALPGVRIAGLMAMPPQAPEPEANRVWFRTLRSLADDVGLTRLSMGTSADFEVAIEEGATDVRVGGALFATP
jgi:PLP dependent protein